MKYLTILFLLLSSTAVAQTYGRPYNDDPYGSYGSVPRVNGYMPDNYGNGGQENLNRIHQQEDYQRNLQQEAQRQLDNMSPSERMGYQQPVFLGGR